MKKDFFDYMLKIMDDNPDVYLIFVGLGWPRLDEFLKKYPSRAINTEASEQTALDIAVGLAYSGKIPFVYTITPFYLRAWETIRTYIDHEKLHVIMIGAGQNDDYGKHDGFSHDATDIREHFNVLKNIDQYYPEVNEGMRFAIDESIKNKKPSFVNIKR